MSFFSWKARHKKPSPSESPAAPARPPKLATGEARAAQPSRSIALGLTESDMVNLYRVGTVRAIAAGELVANGAGANGCSIVVEGSLELSVTVAGATLQLDVMGKGTSVGPQTVGSLAYAMKAREPVTLLDIGGTAVGALPPATQLALRDVDSTAAARRFNLLVARYAELGAKNAQLVSLAQSLTARTSRALATPQLRRALSTIPALPVYATDVTLKLLDERAHAEEIVESIRNNPSLAGLVLKRVNSPYYGLENKVSDYYHALLMLGTTTVYRLILESAVESVVPDLPEAHELQVRAHVVSLIAYEVALVSGKANPLLASTLGLLHNIGNSVALLMQQARSEAAPLAELVEPAALGEAVLVGWGLPERVHRVVGRQREPEFAAPESLGSHAAELAVLWVALNCHQLLFGDGAVNSGVSAYLAWLGVREADCAAFCREVLRPALTKTVDRLPAPVRAQLQGSGAWRSRRDEAPASTVAPSA